MNADTGAQTSGPFGGGGNSLAVMVDHSLVRRTAQPDGTPRLEMLETVREYAVEQLAIKGELEQV